MVSRVMVLAWVERRCAWVVHDWPVGGTNWRGSRQILQVVGGGWAENWEPHAVQIGREDMISGMSRIVSGEREVG